MAENDLLTRLLDAGMTFTALTQARAEELIRDLVRAGAVQAEQAQESVDELLARSRRNSERVLEAVRSEIDDQLGKLDLATRADLERLVHRFADVAATIVAQVAPDRARGSSTTASSRASAPAAVTSSSTTAPAKKTPATKTAAKKSTTKKTAAKKTTAKKSTAKKSTAKKSTAKKSTAKTAAKKAPAEKTAAQKTSTKAAAKKAPAKKSSG
jgi:polyhydroxyalkanoate synthesis regulator phasin